MQTSISVRHNIEVAHRLYLLEGKCENIHGHSMWVELALHGELNENGVLEGLEFGKVKKLFRGFLDETFDHRLLLNVADPWAGSWYDSYEGWKMAKSHSLPGLITFDGDPTTENLANWIADWAQNEFALACEVRVDETAVNSAMASRLRP